MNLTESQKKCLNYFYRNLSMSSMCGEPFDMPYDKRTTNSLVHRGLLAKKYSDHSKHYTGYVITSKGIDLAKEMFGLIMNENWDRKYPKVYDLGYSTARLRENYVDNHSDELPWNQVHKANNLMFKFRDSLKHTLWERRN